MGMSHAARRQQTDRGTGGGTQLGGRQRQLTLARVLVTTPRLIRVSLDLIWMTCSSNRGTSTRSPAPPQHVHPSSEPCRPLWCKKAARVQKVPAGLFCLCVRARPYLRSLSWLPSAGRSGRISLADLVTAGGGGSTVQGLCLPRQVPRGHSALRLRSKGKDDLVRASRLLI